MNEYVNKQELLSAIEVDMTIGKLSHTDGNRLIRYIMQLTAEEDADERV